jgi:hypothetical protein
MIEPHSELSWGAWGRISAYVDLQQDATPLRVRWAEHAAIMKTPFQLAQAHTFHGPSKPD